MPNTTRRGRRWTLCLHQLQWPSDRETTQTFVSGVGGRAHSTTTAALPFLQLSPEERGQKEWVVTSRDSNPHYFSMMAGASTTESSPLKLSRIITKQNEKSKFEIRKIDDVHFEQENSKKKTTQTGESESQFKNSLNDH